MKYLITILFSLCLYLCSGNILYAQVDETTLTVSADVIADLDLTGNQNLSFGTIIQNSKKLVNPVDNTADASGGTVSGITGAENRGYFTVDGSAGTNVEFEVTYKNRLNDNPATDALSLDLTPNGSLQLVVTEDDPASTTTVNAIANGDGTAGEFTCSETGNVVKTVTCSSDNSLELPSGGGIVYVVIGGEVTASETQTVATYSGDITLTATIVN